MGAEIILLADAVAAALSGAALSKPVPATSEYVPVNDFDSITTLRAMVVPAILAPKRLTRGSHDYEYVIHVCVQKRIDKDAVTAAQIKAEVDPLILLMQEIVDFFQASDPDSYGSSRFINLTNDPIFDEDDLYDDQVFTSMLSLHFKQVRKQQSS